MRKEELKGLEIIQIKHKGKWNIHCDKKGDIILNKKDLKKLPDTCTDFSRGMVSKLNKKGIRAKTVIGKNSKEEYHSWVLIDIRPQSGEVVRGTYEYVTVDECFSGECFYGKLIENNYKF